MLMIHSLLLQVTDYMPGVLTKGCFEVLIAEAWKFHYYHLHPGELCSIANGITPVYQLAWDFSAQCHTQSSIPQ